MSVENLKEYARRCATEPELREKARRFGMADVEQHMLHAESLGLRWSPEDVKAFRKELVEAEGGLEDLTEEELGQVAGGALLVTVAASVAVGVGVGAAVVGVGAAVGTTAGAGAAAAAAGGGW